MRTHSLLATVRDEAAELLHNVAQRLFARKERAAEDHRQKSDRLAELQAEQSKIESQLSACHGSYTRAVTSFGLAAAFLGTEFTIVLKTVPWMLDVKEMSWPGIAVTIGVSLTPTALHALFETMGVGGRQPANWLGRAVRAIPVVIGAGLALTTIGLLSDARVTALLIKGSKTLLTIDPAMQARKDLAFQFLTFAVAWLSGLFFAEGAGQWGGAAARRSIRRQLERLAPRLVAAQDQQKESGVEQSSSQFDWEQAAKTAPAHVNVFTAILRDGVTAKTEFVGEPEAEVKRLLALKRLNSKPPEFPDFTERNEGPQQIQ